MGQKKKIAKILEALQGLAGDDVRAKKLKKRKAFETFLRKLEGRRRTVEKKLAEADPGDKELIAVLGEDLERLLKAIRRGKKLLKDM